MDYIIKLNNITKTYNEKYTNDIAINNLSLEIKKGDMIAITGVSGCGKTTLLNIIGCVDKKFKGEYLLSGNNVTNSSNNAIAMLRNQTFGHIPQNFALIEEYSVVKNIMLPLEYLKDKSTYKLKVSKINDLLIKLNLQTKKDKKIIELSGGEKQRVSILRALINEPEIILADEPTSSIDINSGLEVMNILKDLSKDGKTIIIVTHDMRVSSICEKQIQMDDGKLINT